MSDKNIDFEKSLSSLEKIVQKLESGDISLEESISLFEEGMKNSLECKKALENARTKITDLTEFEAEA